MHTLKLGKLIYCDTSIKNKRPILAIIIVMAIWITASTMDYNHAVMVGADTAEYCRHAYIGGDAGGRSARLQHIGLTAG